MSHNLLLVVKQLLVSNIGLRDNVDELIINIWETELKENGIDIHKSSIFQFFSFFKQANARNLFQIKLSNSWSIRRCWQKVQQDFPELRGKYWNERHNLKEPEVRNIIIKHSTELIESNTEIL